MQPPFATEWFGVFALSRCPSEDVLPRTLMSRFDHINSTTAPALLLDVVGWSQFAFHWLLYVVRSHPLMALGKENADENST